MLPGLKRSREESTDATCLQSLPPIKSTQLVLQVFTHKTLSKGERPRNNERLILLGRKALELATTSYLYALRPMLTKEEMDTWLNDIVTDLNISIWSTQYSMAEKVQIAPENRARLETEEERAEILCAYLGGVYVESDMRLDKIDKWLRCMLDGQKESYEEEETPTTPKAKKRKLDPDTPDALQMPTTPDASWEPGVAVAQPPVTHYAQPFLPSPPTVLQPGSSFIGPHPPLGPPPPIPAPPASSKTFLSIFNQEIVKRKCSVEWPSSHTGRPNDGDWTIECVVNGITQGIGRGKSKQIAKEAAGKAAHQAMGWVLKEL